jgi:hypothetical protein
MKKDSWYPDRDLKPGPPEYEAEVSTTMFTSEYHLPISLSVFQEDIYQEFNLQNYVSTIHLNVERKIS